MLFVQCVYLLWPYSGEAKHK